jgi:hypothetical protein
MKLILLAFLLVMIAVVSVVVARRRREQARAERAKALRAEREKRRGERIPNVPANLRGSTGPAPPDNQWFRLGLNCSPIASVIDATRRRGNRSWSNISR